MIEATFKQQFHRLSLNWGGDAYGQEALRIFHRTFKDVPDDIFCEAVDLLMVTCRAKPMLKEFNTAIDEAYELAKDRAAVGARNQEVSFMSLMGHAAQVNTTADPDYVKACMDLLRDKNTGKITSEQFRRGCDELDRLAEQMARSRGLAGSDCVECNGSGYVLLGEKAQLHRCFCGVGTARPAQIKVRKDIHEIPQATREMDFTQARDPRAARVSDP